MKMRFSVPSSFIRELNPVSNHSCEGQIPAAEHGCHRFLCSPTEDRARYSMSRQHQNGQLKARFSDPTGQSIDLPPILKHSIPIPQPSQLDTLPPHNIPLPSIPRLLPSLKQLPPIKIQIPRQPVPALTPDSPKRNLKHITRRARGGPNHSPPPRPGHQTTTRAGRESQRSPRGCRRRLGAPSRRPAWRPGRRRGRRHDRGWDPWS